MMNLDGTTNNFEVFTMTDKAKRDEMFMFYRNFGDENERQVVKFSGVEEVPNVDVLTPTGVRKQYRSTWSVAYPSGRG